MVALFKFNSIPKSNQLSELQPCKRIKYRPYFLLSHITQYVFDAYMI